MRALELARSTQVRADTPSARSAHGAADAGRRATDARARRDRRPRATDRHATPRSVGHDPDPARHPGITMGHAVVVVRLARHLEPVLENGTRLRDVHLLPHTLPVRVVRRDRVAAL